MQETGIRSLGGEDPLQVGMATHSSIPAWRILWTEEPRGTRLMRPSMHIGTEEAKLLAWRIQLKINKYIIKIDKGAGEAEFGPLQRVTA